MSQTPKFWLSAPSWVNNSHSDFCLGIYPRSQKIGDSSATAVAFHLCRSYINARRSPRENINVRFSLNISQLWGGRQLNSYHLDHYGWAQHMWALKVTIQTSWYDIYMEELCWNVLSFWDCLKVCKTTIPLIFAVEAQHLANNCTT